MSKKVKFKAFINNAADAEVDFKSNIVNAAEENKESFLTDTNFDNKGNTQCFTINNKNIITFENTDEALVYLGEFGYKKKIATSLVLLFTFFLGWNDLAYLFYGLDSPWQCVRLETQKSVNSSSCRYNESVGLYSKHFNKRCSLDRTSWKFVNTKDYSMVTEYGLICDKKEDAKLLLFFTPCGRFAGFIPAMLADRYGRKPILFICSFMLGVSNVIGYLSRNLIMIVITLLMTITFQLGALSTGYIIVSEIVGPRKRALVANLYWSAYPASFCLLSLVAYFVPYWRTMRLILCIPAFLLVLLWKFVPESPRWLHVNGRLKEAETELLRQSDTCDVRVKLKKISNHKEVSIKDLFNTRHLLKLDIIFFTINFFIAILYFGVNMSAAILSGNFYLDFAMISAVELPANILVTYFCNRFGRKPTAVYFSFVSFLLFTGIAIIPQSPFGTGYAIARSVLGVLAKFCVTISFNAEFLQVTESYPTSIRSLALCLISGGVLLGNACAPWLTLGLHSVTSYLPFAIMAGISLLIAALCFMTTETKGLPTLEVLEECEK